MRGRLFASRIAGPACIALLAGCAAKGPGPLYMWETFPRHQYSSLLREGAGPEEQIRVLEAHAEKARAGSAAVPPGFRAHLGLLYLNVGNADRARELWLAEKSAFPESTAYMDRLLQRLAATSKPTRSPA